MRRKLYLLHDLGIGAVVFALKLDGTIYNAGWFELLSITDCDIRYHPGKAKALPDALSRKNGKNHTLRSEVGTLYGWNPMPQCRELVTLFGRCADWIVHESPIEVFYIQISYHASIKDATFEALYGENSRSLFWWAEVGAVQLSRSRDST
ncbi:hypothetical protein Tco_0968607 [Tanacetum coccineum]